jgi:anti-sigma regulatory factor (Ser/Thr protein kinase)
MAEARFAHEESLRLPCHPTAASRARQFARRRASPPTADTTELLVSELVTNAVVHARSDVELTISNLGDRTLVEVRDASPRLPEPAPPALGPNGRGLHLVSMLASRWGSQRTATGKTVWFEVRPVA